ncbi:MAG: hypothetical protein H6925_03460 [Holosporaceae bacterium]|nr:MAG: hypothetical protein H6925_03460 [Holosporaceae bacterium]
MFASNLEEGGVHAHSRKGAILRFFSVCGHHRHVKRSSTQQRLTAPPHNVLEDQSFQNWMQVHFKEKAFTLQEQQMWAHFYSVFDVEGNGESDYISRVKSCFENETFALSPMEKISYWHYFLLINLSSQQVEAIVDSIQKLQDKLWVALFEAGRENDEPYRHGLYEAVVSDAYKEYNQKKSALENLHQKTCYVRRKPEKLF